MTYVSKTKGASVTYSIAFCSAILQIDHSDAVLNDGKCVANKSEFDAYCSKNKVRKRYLSTCDKKYYIEKEKNAGQPVRYN